MIELNLKFIAENGLEISWDVAPSECIVTYWHYIEGKNHGSTEFRTRAILPTDLNHNLLLASLRKAYDYLEKYKNG